MKIINYEINNHDLIITEGVSFEEFLVLNDRERFISQKQMFQDYFDTVYKVFLKKLEKFKKLERPIKAKERDGLLRMLKTLFEVKNMIYPDNNNQEDGHERV